jgi:hypothetical protein
MVAFGPPSLFIRNISMSFKVDMAGDDLYVNTIYTGNTTPGNLTATVGNNAGATTLTASTTLTAAQSGQTFVLNALAGFTITLPKPTVGANYIFVIGAVTTSNSYKIITDASTTFLAGGLFFDKALAVTRYAADGSTIRSINLNGTTTGGATIGDIFTIDCVTGTVWSVAGTVTASGTLTTPFATS